MTTNETAAINCHHFILRVGRKCALIMDLTNTIGYVCAVSTKPKINNISSKYGMIKRHY